MFWKIIKWGGTVAILVLVGFAALSYQEPPNPDLPVMSPSNTDTSNNKQFN